jgi:SHS2 domain-containing protein
MQKFEILDISGDVGIKAYGESLKDAFINAAIGMYSLITDLDTVKEEKVIDVSVETDSMEGLLVSWLNELIFHFDAYGFIGKKIVITEFTPSLTLPPRGGGSGGGEAEQLASQQANRLKASIYGEDFDPDRHERKLLVKAATYHQLKVEKKNGKWEIDVIFDI